MNKIKRPDKAIFCALSIMMLFCSIIAIYYLFTLDMNKIYGAETNYSDNWYNSVNEPVNLDETHESIIIHKTLNNVDSSDLLSFVAKNYLVTVVVDDETIYETQKPNSYSGNTAGVEVVSFPIKDEYIDKTIYINLNNPYNDNAGGIKDVVISSNPRINSAYLAKRYISSCMCFVCIMIGILIITIYLPLVKRNVLSSRIFYLGIFAINIGMFMFNDSKVLQIIFGNEFVFHTIAQLWMHTLLIPIVLYVDHTFKEKNNKASNLLCMTSIVLFIVCVILNFLGIKDLHETIFLVHYTYILGIVYVIHLFFKHRSSFKKYISHIISIGCLAFGVVLDIIMINFAYTPDTSPYTRIGMLAFLTIEIINAIVEKMNDYELEVKMKVLSSLAYHDGLTNLLNRNSFIEALDRLTPIKENVIIAMFDVNDLKKINDTYGHSAGDDLIIEASSAISKFPGVLGKTYRIGGDEFVVIIEDKEMLDELKVRITEMNKYLKEVNKTKEYTISIAFGYSAFKTSRHKSLTDTFNDADEAMYKNKMKIKSDKNYKKIKK